MTRLILSPSKTMDVERAPSQGAQHGWRGELTPVLGLWPNVGLGLQSPAGVNQVPYESASRPKTRTFILRKRGVWV